MNPSEWSIQQLAAAASVTSRTLRHYHDIGLLEPSRIGRNGYRYYDEDCLVRLQRILLLRQLGLDTSTIRAVLDGQRDETAALRTHVRLLEHERERLDRQIAAVAATITHRQEGRPIMASEAFEGFDHAQFKDEVVQRWGQDAWDSGDRWWSGLSAADKAGFTQAHLDVVRDYGAARQAGLEPGSPQVQSIAQRHYDWLVTAYQGTRPGREWITNLAQMWVDDPRFAENYQDAAGPYADYVRDAMVAYADANLD